jgi:hypothetical protein
MGAGVECSFASLCARERPDPDAGLERERFMKDVTRKNCPGEEERPPWP